MTKQQLTVALPRARSSRLVIQELENETVIYDQRSHKATCLNDFSAEVWRLCDGNSTVHDITESLGLDESAEHAVAVTLKKLARADLLTSRADEAIPKDHTRRDVIHGALLAAVPVVTTVTIPTSAAAQSCLPDGAPCNSNEECCNGDCGGVCGAGG